MKQFVAILFFAILLAEFSPAQTGVNDFLNLDYDIRSSGMGGSAISSTGASAIFGNPSRLFLDGELAFASHEQLYDGLVMTDAAGASFKIGKGIFGAGFLFAGGDGIKVTAIPNPELPVSAQNRPYIIEEKGHYDFALLAGYAIPFREKFCFGASVGTVYRKLVYNNALGGEMSLGANWAVRNDISLGLALKNISYVSWNTGANEFGAPNADFGLAYRKKFGEKFDIGICADGIYFPQGSGFSGSAGIEMTYSKLVSLRVGTKNCGFAAGGDIRIMPNLRVGASMNLHTDLPVSYRVGAIYERSIEGNSPGE
jgi:PPE-repeat protein